MQASSSEASRPTPAVDASCCPLCGAANGCAEEAARISGTARQACWCMQANIAPAALARISADARGQACICARCAAATPQQPAAASPIP